MCDPKAQAARGRRTAHQEVGAGAGDESERVIARLHVLPEVHVGMVEDVAVQVEVVEALRGQHHAHIIAPVEQRQRLQEEFLAGHLAPRSTPSPQSAALPTLPVA